MEKYLLRLFLLLSFVQMAQVAKGETANSLKSGVAEVTIRINVKSESGELVNLGQRHFDWLDSLRINVATLPLFSTSPDSDDLIYTELSQKNGVFSGEVPVNRVLEVGGIQFKSEDVRILGCEVMLCQDMPVEIELTLTELGSMTGFPVVNDATSGSIINWLVINEIMTQAIFMSPPHIWNPDKLYSEGWEKVRNEEDNVIYPKFLKTSLERKESRMLENVPTGILSEKMLNIVKNNLKIVFAIDETLLYVRRAEKALDKKIIAPPMEAYSFLNEIDYTPDVFLINFMELPMGMFFKEILQIPGSGIEEIGETPVAKWQKEVKQILAPAIKEPTKLLMDLLAGMSYVLQIDKRIPLSEEQISNIDKGFTDDIGKIVLSYNTDLARRAQEH